MSAKYYECHITLEPPADAGLRKTADDLAKLRGFKTSVLKGDEVMGDDALLYCTSHDRDVLRMHERMNQLADDLASAGLRVLRRKIEHVIFDVREPR